MKQIELKLLNIYRIVRLENLSILIFFQLVYFIKIYP